MRYYFQNVYKRLNFMMRFMSFENLYGCVRANIDWKKLYTNTLPECKIVHDFLYLTVNDVWTLYLIQTHCFYQALLVCVRNGSYVRLV